MKSTSDILERIHKNSTEHKDGVYTRLYRYLLREDIYYSAYQKLYANKGAGTKGIDNDTADGFGEKYVKSLIEEIKNQTYNPKPVRRKYIKKKNGKLRPLGIPSFRDKLLQEVMRQFLESIYEPIFSDNSHGFRPNRSCHTALKQMRCNFTGIKWFIEGDIKGCFDNIDHDKLIEILQRKIKDSKFINIIRQFLKAGYMEDWKYHQTHSGTPQGGILSPILANIYLNELDTRVSELKLLFEKPITERYNPEYREARNQVLRMREKLKKAVPDERVKIISELTQLEKKQKSLPRKPQTDKRLVYVRYADDWLIGISGCKKDAENLKADLKEYLTENLYLELSEEKTFITHSSQNVRFLGYDIKVRRNQQVKTKKDGTKQRTMNNTIELTVPLKEKIEKFLFDKNIVKQKENGKLWPIHRPYLLNLADEEIVQTYNLELRGILNYYHLTSNYNKLTYFRYLMEYSCLKTLAGKYKTSVKGIIDRYRAGKSWAIKYQTKNGMAERQLVKLADCKKYNGDIVTSRIRFSANNSIKSRLATKTCELCGKKNADCYEIHHANSLRSLSGNTEWEKVMLNKRRKTLVVCGECHKAIHS